MDKLSKEEQTRVKSLLSDTFTYYLKFKKRNAHLKVGEVYITDKKYDFQETGERVKWLYFYEDPDTGIGFFKRMTSTGKWGTGIYCDTKMDYGTNFQIDPDYIENIILNDTPETFDPGKAQKEKNKDRAKILRANRKLINALSPSDLASFSYFNVSLQLGDEVRMGYSVKDLCSASWDIYTTYIVTKKEPHKVTIKNIHSGYEREIEHDLNARYKIFWTNKVLQKYEDIEK